MCAVRFNSICSNPYFCPSAGPIGPPGPPGSPSYNSNATQSHSAFSVRLGEYNPSSETIIRFREVIYNQQNHYNTTSGTFTCVFPGVYEFSFLVTSFVSVGNVKLVQNGEVVLGSFKSYQGGQHLSSGDTVLHLAEGDEVWLEASGGTVGMSTRSHFSGHLLYVV